MVPFYAFAQDNGNEFNLIWDDPDEIVGASGGYVMGPRSEGAAHHLQVINDYDGNGFMEVVGWDYIDDHYFVIEANGDDSFIGKKFFQFFPFFIDLNDDGIEEAIYIDTEGDPDSVIIQLYNYDAGSDDFVIDRVLGKFVKPADDPWGGVNREYLMEFYIAQDNFDDDSNSETVIYSFDRWVNPAGGQTTYLVVFELTSDDIATAGIKIEHLETIVSGAFQVPVTIRGSDLDNDGHREMVMVSMEAKRIYIYESQGEDQYEFVYDASQYAQDAEHTYVSLTDIEDLDGDGLDDLWFCGAHGAIYVIPGTGSYESTFTYENSVKIMTVEGATQVMAGLAGDLDADGKPNMYWHDLSTESIFEMEYQGGDLRDPDNFIYTVIYQSDLTNPTREVFLGLNIGALWNGEMDLDKDGKRDFVVVVNALVDLPRFYVFESIHQYATEVKGVEHNFHAPSDFALMTGFPNPAYSRITLEFELKMSSKTQINIFNSRGQLVKKLDKKYLTEGTYREIIDTKGLPSGIYFARLVTHFGQKTEKLLLIN